MKRILTVAWLLVCLLLLTACQAKNGSFTVRQEGEEALALRLMDVWQDTNRNVMVSLAGTGNGTLLDAAVQWDGDKAVGRRALSKVSVRILSDGEWLESSEYPEGMFSTSDNGSLTVRFHTSVVPVQVEVSGTVLTLSELKLPGVDHTALEAAEAEVIRQREETGRAEEEAAQKRLADAKFVAPTAQADESWIDSELLAAGESLYYTCTGLNNAQAAGIGFILSADGKSARDIHAVTVGATDGKKYVNGTYVLKMTFTVDNGRLNVDQGAIVLDVTIAGDSAVGIFEYRLEDGKDALGRETYVSCGVARVEMVKRR